MSMKRRQKQLASINARRAMKNPPAGVATFNRKIRSLERISEEEIENQFTLIENGCSSFGYSHSQAALASSIGLSVRI
jgi:hypothetical protein